MNDGDGETQADMKVPLTAFFLNVSSYKLRRQNTKSSVLKKKEEKGTALPYWSQNSVTKHG